MPNWPLSERVKTYLIDHTVMLSQRKLDYAQNAFPLTATQIQYSIMPEEKVDTLRRYISEGTQTIEKHKFLRLALLRSVLPELPRGVVLNLTLPEWIVVDRGTRHGMSSPKYTMDDQHYLVPDFDGKLSPDERRTLLAWVARSVRQARLHRLICHTVGNIVRHETKVAPTVAHLHQLWPLLTTYMNSDPVALNARWAGDREFYQMWRERFRAPVRPMKAYNPTHETTQRYAKIIQHADVVLTAGMLLPKYEADTTVVQAYVEHWETLDGDIVV